MKWQHRRSTLEHGREIDIWHAHDGRVSLTVDNSGTGKPFIVQVRNNRTGASVLADALTLQAAQRAAIEISERPEMR